MKKILRKLTASLLLPALVVTMWWSAGKSQDKPGRNAGSASSSMVRGAALKSAEMPYEEKLVRDVYARLMRYQSAAVDEEKTRTGKPAQPRDYLAYELRVVRSGATSEILDRPIAALATSGNNESIRLKRISLGAKEGAHSSYEATWASTSAKQKQNGIEDEWLRDPELDRYVRYRVNVRFQGREAAYVALMLYQSKQQVSGRPERVQIVDHVTSDMNDVYSNESPRVIAPWEKYVKSSLYQAVLRSIKEGLAARAPLLPLSAPIGYLPGDDVSPNEADARTMALNTSCQTNVQEIQYQDGNTFVSIAGTLYVLKGTPVTFKAIPEAPATVFSPSQPTWSGTSGASGTGETVSVTFNTASTSLSDAKTVIASTANSVTVNVIVYELTGKLTPRDDFTGRSTTDFGVGEIIDLSFTATPAVTAAQAGGLLWKQTVGHGTLTAATDGTGVYTAASSPESATLKLEVQNGPSKTQGPTKTISIVAPNGAYQVQAPGTGIKHVQGTCSVGFQARTYLEPRDVSFINIEAREGTTTATATGWLAGSNGAVHTTGNWMPIAGCTASTGCVIQAIDSIYNEYPMRYGGTRWGIGEFRWNIPREWRSGTGTATPYTTLLHLFQSDGAGGATISKGGAGPFQRNPNDPTSNF